MAFYLAGGLMDFVVPFALTFAIAVGVISTTGIFKGQKPVEFLIAIALAALAASSQAYVRLLNAWAPVLAGLLIVVFFIVFLKKNLGGKPGEKSWEMLIAIAILFLVLIYIGPSLPLPSGNIIKSDDILLVAGLALVIAILVVGKNVSWPDDRNTT
ncbi:MAG: hypothetical protein ACP5E4_04555 [Candidatus Aenigmatarchaeota archaeon]